MATKHPSIVNQLRELYPGEEYTSERCGFSWVYVGNTQTVRTCSLLTGLDDEQAITVYIAYPSGVRLGSCGTIYGYYRKLAGLI